MSWITSEHDAAKTLLMGNGFIPDNPSRVMLGTSVFPPLPGLPQAGMRVSYRLPCYSDSYESHEDILLGDRQADKKRRHTPEQVKSMELSFEMENKLEPERKQKLAKELGLQPRQVAVWFQNRRARWKTKQLEQDFDVLKSKYESVVAERERLRAEVFKLTMELQVRRQQKENRVQLKNKEERSRVVTETPAQVLDPESKTLEKEFTVDSEYAETIDGDSPLPDCTVLYVQEAADNSETHQMGTPQQVDTPGSSCLPFQESYDTVNQSYAYQHFSAKLEDASPSEEPYSIFVFSMDVENSAWL